MVGADLWIRSGMHPVSWAACVANRRGFLCLAAFILAIIGMANGRVAGGVFLLCGALIGAPLGYGIVPLISSSMGAQALPQDQPAKR